MKLHLKFLIVFLTVVVVSCTKKTTTTNSRNDSVEKYLKLASIDTLPLETRKKYNHKAFSFIDLEKNDTTVRWYLCDISRNFMLIHDSIGFYKVSKIYFEISTRNNDKINLARFFYNKAGFHRVYTKKMDSAYYFYNKAEKLYMHTRNKKRIAECLLFKGLVLSFINDYSGAELQFQKSEKLVKHLDDDDISFILNSNYGLLCIRTSKYEKAIFYNKEALKKIDFKNSKKTIDYINKCVLLSNLGECYYHLKLYKKALFYYEKAINYKKLKEKDLSLYSCIIADMETCKRVLLIPNKIPNAYFDKLIVSEKFNYTNDICKSLMDLSKFYFEVKDTLKAQHYADKALLYAKKSLMPNEIMSAWKQIGIVNKARSSEAITQFDIQVDSLLNRERRERSKFLKIQLETDEITQEKEKAIKQKWVQTSIIASVLVIVILLFVIYKQQSQKKEFLLIQSQQKANEEIYQLMLQQQRKEEEAKQKEKKRIALELHDNVMNKLASTRFNLFTLTQQTTTENTKNAKLHIQTIKEIEDEIRNLTHELSKEYFLDDNSFTSMVLDLVSQQNQMHPTDYQLQIDEAINWETISSEIKMNLYRIIQEAIHNCNKYANATQVQIKLTKEDNQLHLSIKDNGIGFDVNQANQGIGLDNMQQRIDSINGKITIDSTPETGTKIKCTVEIKN